MLSNSKSPLTMDLWSKNHSLSSGYCPQTQMVLDHKTPGYWALTITLTQQCYLIASICT